MAEKDAGEAFALRLSRLQLLSNFIVGGEVDYQKLYLGLSWVYVAFCIAEQRDGLACGVQKMFSLWT